MTNERWRQIEEVFNRALDIPPAERRRWLAEACGTDAELLAEVSSLLDNDSTSSRPLEKQIREAFVAFEGRPVARMAGPYELLEEIGRGGMGTVYKARRADEEYQAIVAVKLVRPGMDTDFILSRFRRERQILARLSHPNIARLLDGGTTADEIPYIVMEFIDGVKITEYCRRESLGLRERLQLFLPVCLAVDYAHRNFVVHRDIKPGNILVDNTGTPKLLDFGICKLLHSSPLELEETMTQAAAMLTPDYASPEQVQGEAISARSDVYSLGAVLYEIVTGKRPHRFEKMTPIAIEEAICEKPVLPPSQTAEPTTAKLLRGDIDNIILRALEKDPDRRYESAAALAQDISRFLENLPVQARAATASYRIRKWIVRHRGLSLAASALLLSMAAGTYASWRQAKKAEAREQEVRALAHAFLFDVHDSIRDLPGATQARQKILSTAVQYLDRLSASHPSEAALLRELAAGYQRVADLEGSDGRGANLGNPKAALANYAKSIALWDQVLTQEPNDTASAVERLTALRRLADLESSTIGLKDALVTFDRAEKEGRALLARDPRNKEARNILLEILTANTRRLREAGSFQQSLETGQQALTLAQQLASENPQNHEAQIALSSSEAAIGMTQARLGRLEEAAQNYRRVVERNERLAAAQPGSVATQRALMISYSHLGDVLGYPDLPNLGDQAASEQIYSKMVAIARKLYASDSRDARAAMDLGIATLRWAVVTPPNDPALKLSRLEEARALLAKLPTNLNVITYRAIAEQYLGQAALRAQQEQKALAHWRSAIQMLEPHADKGAIAHVRALVIATCNLAPLEAKLGQKDVAIQHLDAARAVAEASAAKVRGDDEVSARVQRARVYTAYARAYKNANSATSARAWREQALTEWQAIAGRPGFLSNFRDEMQRFEKESGYE